MVALMLRSGNCTGIKTPSICRITPRNRWGLGAYNLHNEIL